MKTVVNRLIIVYSHFFVKKSPHLVVGCEIVIQTMRIRWFVL